MKASRSLYFNYTWFWYS